jgi:hypothetical protein
MSETPAPYGDQQLMSEPNYEQTSREILTEVLRIGADEYRLHRLSAFLEAAGEREQTYKQFVGAFMKLVEQMPEYATADDWRGQAETLYEIAKALYHLR